MDSKQGKQTMIIIILSLAVLTMSFSFAFNNDKYYAALNVIEEDKAWDISFDSDNLLIEEGSVEGSDPIVSGSTVSFNLVLNDYNDYYEFSLPINNNGDYDATLDSIIISGLNDEQKESINYILSYTDNFDYTTIYSEINNTNINIPLYGKSTHKVSIRIEYKNLEDTDENEVKPESLSLSATLNYKQKKN